MLSVCFSLFLLFWWWWGGGGVKAKGASDYIHSDQQSFVSGLNAVTSKRSFRAGYTYVQQ